ncbi:MAG: phosphate/phosphite/phosphonate ABC transporter substrate-binding protein [Phycisphaerae bacterium]
MLLRASRSFFMCIVATAAMAAGSGCAGGAAADRGVVQIGSTKAGLFGLPPEYLALHPRLEAVFEHRVRFSAQPDGIALGQQLEQGQISFAIMSCSEYAQVVDPTRLKLLASAVNTAGKTSRKAFLVAKADYNIKSIADCKGRRFAFGAHGDLLTDLAAQAALEKGGVSVKDLLSELVLLTPPPFAFEGRLYRGKGVATTILADITVNAGVIDEIDYAAMPDAGGNFITGPSKDLFVKLGETRTIPERVVVAGPNVDQDATAKLTDFLVNKVKDDPNICRQLGVAGFAPADRAAYDHVRQWLSGLK